MCQVRFWGNGVNKPQEWRMYSAGAAKRRYPTSKVRSSGREEILHVQGQERWLRFAGAAVKRYPMSKIRETQVRR